MAEPAHPRRPPRLDVVFDQGTPPVYFVTFCTYHRLPWLACPAVHESLVAFGRRALQEHRIVLGRHVIMPDHVHLFVTGGPAFNLADWIRLLKQCLGKALDHQRSGRVRLWQEGFFDHVLRNDESMSQKWDYIRQNPERAGLVDRAEAWPHQGEIGIIDRV